MQPGAVCEAADTTDGDGDGDGADPSAWQLEGDFFYAGTRDHVRRYARSRITAAPA